MALLRNEAHVTAVGKAIDEFIMRAMGNTGPPPSKFYIAELKDVASRLFPPVAEAGDAADSDASEASDVM